MLSQSPLNSEKLLPARLQSSPFCSISILSAHSQSAYLIRFSSAQKCHRCSVLGPFLNFCSAWQGSPASGTHRSFLISKFPRMSPWHLSLGTHKYIYEDFKTEPFKLRLVIYVRVPGCTHRGWGTSCRDQPSPFNIWVPGTELKLLCLVAGACYLLTHLTVPLPSFCYLISSEYSVS